MIPTELSLNKIEKVYKILSNHVLLTPVIKDQPSINEILNTNAFFKLEFLQHSGTFKARGAINNILNIKKDLLKKGITTVSAGNHAIATSYVADKFKLKNKIFMYESANDFRVQKCKYFNSNIEFTDAHSAFKKVEEASKDGYYFVHPFDGPNTLQGTASLGFEIFNQFKYFDNVIISVGGGGLISGVGSTIKQLNPNCKIIGIEPEGAKGMTESLKMNKPIKDVKLNTIADSLAAPLHMEYSYRIAKQVIDNMYTVSDKEMINAMKIMYDKFKLILEPACSATIAALLGPLNNKLKNQNTVIILCGTNIDVKTWTNLIKH